ncbi:MAG: hypothetical protein H6609_17160 [Ignavibacteriales bacterium]|nr:hypothetical protein [Ignavibacteriales bacterium]
MRKIIFLIIVTFIIFSCQENPTKSDTDNILNDSFLSDSLKQLYQIDAYRLALRDMKENDEDYLNKTEISEELYSQYYKGIINIFNSEYTSQVDSILNIFQIHTFGKPRFNSISIGFESDSVLFENISNNLPSGISKYDSLIQYYGFRLTSTLIFPEVGFFRYWTDKINNIEAICYELEKIPKVKNANPNSIGGDGNDIIGKILEDKIEYDFIYKWGDCWAGCISSHTWRFIVSNNGSAEFIKSFGDEIQ